MLIIIFFYTIIQLSKNMHGREFQVLLSPEELMGYAAAQIARINHLKANEVQTIEVAALASILTGNTDFLGSTQAKDLLLSCSYYPDLINFLFRKYLGLDKLERGREMQEKGTCLILGAELLLNTPVLSTTYGLFFPSYSELLQRYREENPVLPEGYSSLLVGAMSTNTIFEFQALNKAFFPNGHTYVIDLEGVTLGATDNFVLGDGYHLPYGVDSFSTIQTNYLLHSLREPKNPEQHIKLFAEFYRVLKPGGCVLSVEGRLNKISDGTTVEQIRQELQSELREAGFQNLNIGYGYAFASRSGVIKSLCGSPIYDQPVEPEASALQIYAKK
ncbi:methyltransferase domain-containing protein [Candidatus Beckwithbacteria bacterium]|nr:methyltransferase domain-containing protein [Candidatus Beckwithbacteria bacterium]